MKEFSDFLASITLDVFEDIMSDANQKAAEVRALQNADDKSNLGNQIAAVSYTIALELLALYHKWLEQ